MQFFSIMLNQFQKFYRRIILRVASLNNNIQERVESFGSQIITFGIVGTINYPVYYIIWSFSSRQAYESLALRSVATILCIPLIFKNYWPRRAKSYLPLYWYITLLFCLPIFFTFFLLKNHGASVWLMSTITVIFWLLLLVDWVSFIILTVSGITIACVAYYFTTLSVYIPDKALVAQFIGTFAIIAIFAHNKERFDKIKLKTLFSFGATIAHELRTPLRSISSTATGIKEHLPTLIKSYEIAKSKHIELPFLDPIYHEGLRDACITIESETHYAFTFIDMLLIKANQIAISDREQVCSMINCINNSLNRYPFDLGDKELIIWNYENEKDFLFNGDETLVIHILFNLLKNALYYVKAANKGNIVIWLESYIKTNELHFKDTGQGISQKNLPHIFERFFSKTRHGTGIGLYFCKLAMEAMGGKIICHSQEGEYTEFVLVFPSQDPSTFIPRSK